MSDWPRLIDEYCRTKPDLLGLAVPLKRLHHNALTIALANKLARIA